MADSEEVKTENDTSNQDKVENTEVEAEVINTSDNDKCTKKDVIVTDSDAKSEEPIENHEETKMINQDLKPESSENTEPKGRLSSGKRSHSASLVALTTRSGSLSKRPRGGLTSGCGKTIN